jgi:glycine cleavage system P protein (glycine dehydrogenase) subunit 1
MTSNVKKVHPYIPNSVPGIQEEMLKVIQADSVEALYSSIPEELRFRKRLGIPEGLTSEFELRRHMDSILSKNKTCDEYLSFLGAGCYQHYVPAICDEVNQRSEFLTAYAGEPFEDHGRFQTLFEYESMMAELLDVDVVNVPTYDGGQAASTALRMAGRITGRSRVLISRAISPERLLIIENYCRGVLSIDMVNFDPETGLMNLEDLGSKMSDQIAGIYSENPSVFGNIESRGQQISDLAHKYEALSIFGVEPLSLGILAPPSQYGADISTGDIQSLGMHMQYGGGQAGFIATRDEEKFVMQYPSRLFGLEKTNREGEWGFGDVAWDRTSFADRDACNEFIGTATALWGITAGVYLALMGPQGMNEIGETILQKTEYLRKKLSEIKNLSILCQNTAVFREVVVDFSATGKSITEINQSLLEKGIFGGKDLSDSFAELKNCALLCVTEIHSKSDIDRLVNAIDTTINQ